MPKHLPPHVGVSKRGRMSLPSRPAKPALVLTTKVMALPEPIITWITSVDGERVAYIGNRCMGSEFTEEQLCELLS